MVGPDSSFWGGSVKPYLSTHQREQARLWAFIYTGWHLGLKACTSLNWLLLMLEYLHNVSWFFFFFSPLLQKMWCFPTLAVGTCATPFKANATLFIICMCKQFWAWMTWMNVNSAEFVTPPAVGGVSYFLWKISQIYIMHCLIYNMHFCYRCMTNMWDIWKKVWMNFPICQ